MPRPKAQVEAGLLAKGFVQRETHHRYFVSMSHDGKVSRARTKTSHTPRMKDIPDNLLSQMAHQCALTKRQLLELVDCPLDRAAYEALLVEQGML